MAQMVARYEREKKLNVREQPHQAARVVRTLSKGDVELVKRIENGWAELPDGFANVAYLTVELGNAAAAAARAVAETAAEIANPAEPAEITKGEPEGEQNDEAAELRKMTNPQLYDLAEQSGVKVKKGASKAEIIAAILADE